MASGSVSQTLRPGDVVDNLTSTATDKPLSAAQGKALNDNINPYGTKYIRGKFDVSSGSPTTVLGKIQAFISGVTTDNKEVDFDVMLSYQGIQYFIGHLYPGKDWGHGFYIAIDGIAYKWTRLNNVDSVEELALNSKRQLTITAGAHVAIDKNDSYICGKVMVINFKCHATSAIGAAEQIANIEETTIFDCVVPLVVGGEWSVTGPIYGYVTGKSVIAGNISNGQYIHVNFTTLYAY